MTLKLAWANVRRSYKDFAIYFFTLLIGVAVFYAFNSIKAQQGVLTLSKTQGQMIDMLGMLTDIVSVLVCAIMAFLVVYASRFLIRRRNKEFGLYLLLGMPRGALLRLTAAETLMVGFVSLAAGLALGVGISQGLVWVTAVMFQANMSQAFTFLFAPDVALLTVAVFCAVFVFSLLVNVGYLMRAKLIDLLNAGRKNEALTLRSIPLSLFLFTVACACIGVAYYLLLKNGLLASDGAFWASTVLVCVGTVLFFYSLSGFLLRAVQLVRPLYYRGLNMFALREVASRVNSTFASMSVVCLTLFLAITSVCGGVGICNAMNNGYHDGYDATVRFYAADRQDDAAAGQPVDRAQQLADAFAAENGTWDALVEETAQVDYYDSDFTLAGFDALAKKPLSSYDSSIPDGYQRTPVCVVKLSQYNRALELAGLQPVDLQPGCAFVSCDMDMLGEYYESVAESGGEVAPYGTALKLTGRFDNACLETTSTATNSGALVVNDADVPADTQTYSSILDVSYVGSDAEATWENTMEKVEESGTVPSVAFHQTKQQVHDQGIGLTTVVSYLAVYIGLVLVVACAAILAIQQLTAASDNRKRYELLAKLGATQGMLDGALFKQIAIAFLFPLGLAVCHSTCAMKAVVDVVQMFGHIEIGEVALITAAGFLVVYCIYFVLTFFQARGLIKREVR